VSTDRKSHAERSEETRNKIIEAVVDCIAEKGLKKTTTSAIAKKAGVTWGAIQHHFGGLNGCLIAAFDASFQRFVATLGIPPSSDETLQERIENFVQRAWQHYSGTHYLSMFQLLLNDMTDVNDSRWLESKQKILQDMDQVWKNFFHDVIPNEKQRRMLAHYTHSVLTGLAVSYSYSWDKEVIDDELLMLQESLIAFINR